MSVVDRASVHQPVLGTTLELRIIAADERIAREAEDFAVAEARLLEERLTVFDERSELCRWRRGEVDAPSQTLVDLLAAADRWQRRSAGSFNPMAGLLSQRWRRAEREGLVPAQEELADLAAAVAAPRFEVRHGAVRPLGDLADLNLNAIAKGFVVDRVAAATSARFPLAGLLVNAGGDLLHRGRRELVVGIEDPHRPFDNAAPLTAVRLGDRALATSGSSRRWFDVGGERFNQILDPRTGWPVSEVVSASVVAADAATADVVATILSVLPAGARAAFLRDLADDPEDPVEVASLVVSADGEAVADDGWRRLEA